MSTPRTNLITLARRDGATCWWCGLPVVVDGFPSPAPDGPHYFATIDHVIPRSRGGSNQLRNKVLACLPCNHAKADRVVGETWVPIAGHRGGRFRNLEDAS